MTFGDHETFTQRVRSAFLGQIEYQLSKQLGLPLDTSKIERKEGVVKVKGEILAEIENDSEVKYAEPVTLIKHDVEKAMKAKKWMQNRRE